MADEDMTVRMQEALADLCYQFAVRSQRDGRLAITTGGLSALEEAFDILGWDDPQPWHEAECERDGCTKEATCGTPTPDGYKRLCGDHMREIWRP